MVFTTFLAFVISFASVFIAFSLIGVDTITLFLFLITIPVFASSATFAVLYFYPSQRASSLRKSIENDLPFAVAHMSSITSSGIPPEAMFELLTGFEEYKEVARQASLVVRNIKTFGMSSVKAIASASQITPSPEWRQILNGVAFTIEKGGNLPLYLKEMSEKNLFEYRIKREKYLKTLSTYADIYTALLVAAPLMMLALLAILSVIGGEVIGLTIPDLITLLTFGVLPFLNIAFLAFIHLTHPGG